jgi:hypothetical protein
VAGKYEAQIDRESAFEKLRVRADAAAKEAEAAAAETARAEAEEAEYKKARRYDPTPRGSIRSRRTKEPEGFGGAVANVVIKELKGTTGRRIVRGILGSIFRSR